jgi:hypothetical protein
MGEFHFHINYLWKCRVGLRPTYMYRLPQLACSPVYSLVILIVLLFIITLYLSLLGKYFLLLDLHCGLRGCK